MSTPSDFFSRWCFYCKSGHDSASDLREHVRMTHPTSAREARYRDAEQALSPSS